MVNLELRNSRSRVFLAGESFQLLCNFRPGKLFLSLETEDLVAIVPFYDLWADPSLDIDICLCLGTRNNHLTVTATANFLNNSLLRFPEFPPSPLTSYLVLLANSQAWSESKLFSKKKILLFNCFQTPANFPGWIAQSDIGINCVCHLLGPGTQIISFQFLVIMHHTLYSRWQLPGNSVLM